MLRPCRLAVLMIAMAGTFWFSPTAFAQMHYGDSPKDTSSLDRIRSAYRAGHDEEAIVLSDRALAETLEDLRVARSEIHFWRGASLRRLKRYQEALVALDLARDLGFATSELHLERALTLRSLGKKEEADQEYQDAEKGTQDDKPQLEELRRRWRESDGQEKTFQLRLYPQSGYDSNVFTLSDDTLLAEEEHRASFYYGVQISARYALYQEKETSLLLDYENVLRGYASDRDLSYSDNLLSAIWHSPFGKLNWLAYEVRGSYGETFLSSEGHFRTQRIIAPALIFRPDEEWQFRLWGDWNKVNYYETVPPEQDRDGTIYRIGLASAIPVGDGWKLGPYVTFWRYQAEGNDIGHHAWEVGTNIIPPLFVGLQLTGTLGYVLADYDNPNSLTGFTEARHDRRFIARLTVTLRFLEKPLGFAPTISVGYEKWNSNISAFTFDRWDLGFSTDILALSF